MFCITGICFLNIYLCFSSIIFVFFTIVSSYYLVLQVSYKGSKDDSDVVTRAVRDSDLARIIKSISRGDNVARISKKIYQVSSLREGVQKLVLNDISSECCKLSSDKGSCILRDSKSQQLASFSLEKWNLQLQTETPLLYKTILSLCKKEIGTAITAAIALRFRNKKMTALHHIVSQVLDNGGATEEV